MAWRKAGSPAPGEYLCIRGSRQASTAASTMAGGVGKSGSPAPKPITFSPAAFRALALASTARVADSWIAAMRAEMRDEVAGEVATPHGGTAGPGIPTRFPDRLTPWGPGPNHASGAIPP